MLRQRRNAPNTFTVVSLKQKFTRTLFLYVHGTNNLIIIFDLGNLKRSKI